MAVAPTIPSPCLLQVMFDVCCLRCVDVNVLRTKVSEKMARCRHTATRSRRRVSFYFQVILQF
jgi:hypothetical protein